MRWAAEEESARRTNPERLDLTRLGEEPLDLDQQREDSTTRRVGDLYRYLLGVGPPEGRDYIRHEAEKTFSSYLLVERVLEGPTVSTWTS